MRFCSAAVVALLSWSCSSAPKLVAPVVAARPPALPEVATPEGYVTAEQRRTERPTITVTDPGGSPRRYLVYAPAVGSKVELEGDADRGAGGPRIRYRVEREIVAVDSGWITYRGTLRSMEYVPRPTDPEEWQALADLFPTFVGAFEIGQVNVRGEFERAKSYKPDAGSNVLSELMVNFSAFFEVPPQPIGPGGRWKVVYDFTTSVETIEYRITDWQGDRIVVDATDASVGPRETGKGTFHFEVDLARGTTHSVTDSSIHVEGDGKPARDMTGHIELTMDPR